MLSSNFHPGKRTAFENLILRYYSSWHPNQFDPELLSPKGLPIRGPSAITSLTLSSSSHDCSGALSTISQYCPNLKRLTFDSEYLETGLEEEVAQQLFAMKSLDELRLQWQDSLSLGLKIVEQMAWLRSVFVKTTERESMQELSLRTKDLQSLHIYYEVQNQESVQHRIQNIEALMGMENLRSLQLRLGSQEGIKEFMKSLLELPGTLESFSLIYASCQIEAEDFRRLVQMVNQLKNLQALKIEDVVDEILDISLFKTNLRSIDLTAKSDRVRLTSNEFSEFLVKNREIQDIKFEHCDVNDAAIKDLAHLRLRGLEIPYSQVTSVGIQQLVTLQPQLRVLNLNECKRIGNLSLLSISTLPELEQLNICESEITDKGLTYLRRLRRMRKIELRWNWITTRETLKLIGNWRSMDHFHLPRVGLSDRVWMTKMIRSIKEGTQVWFRQK